MSCHCQLVPVWVGGQSITESGWLRSLLPGWGQLRPRDTWDQRRMIPRHLRPEMDDPKTLETKRHLRPETDDPETLETGDRWDRDTWDQETFETKRHLRPGDTWDRRQMIPRHLRPRDTWDRRQMRPRVTWDPELLETKIRVKLMT